MTDAALVPVCLLMSLTGGTESLLRVVSVLHHRGVGVQELTCLRQRDGSTSTVRLRIVVPARRVEHVRACIDRVVDVVDLRVGDRV